MVFGSCRCRSSCIRPIRAVRAWCVRGAWQAGVAWRRCRAVCISIYARNSAARPLGSSFGILDGPGPYLAADCDVSSSSMAYVLVSLLQSSAK